MISHTLPTLLSIYQQLVTNNHIERNAAQEDVIYELNPFYQKLSNTPNRKNSFFCFNRKSPEVPQGNHHRGIYLYGDVGRGKSMMMDLFFHHIHIASKQRLHFHQFMSLVHNQLRELRKHSTSSNPKLSFNDKESLLFKAADILSQKITLLCFDELQVTNIADAMILGPLFKHLMDKGVFIIVTSNRQPRDLYKDGLQREHFLPFIALIENQFKVLELNAEKDFRLGRLKHMDTCYFHPLGQASQHYIDNAFNRFTNGQMPATTDLSIQGRTLHFNHTASDIVLVDFEQLCSHALGASDYREIATSFSVVMLQNIPIFTVDLKNELLRFITLIDQLYEHRVKLICTADAPVEHLCSHNLEVFEFARTQSRLHEMQSQSYWKQTHLAQALNENRG